jgi:hypothetical protein
MIEWEPMISIESNGEDIRFDGVEVESYRGIITCLNYFLALVTASPSYQYAVEGVRRNRDLQSKYCWVNPVEIYGNADIFPPKYDQRHRIIARENVLTNSQAYFSNWISKFARFQGPITLLVGSLQQANVYGPERFFNVATALEGIHRVCFPESARPSDEHSSKIEKIYENCPPELQDWLRRKLKPKPRTISCSAHKRFGQAHTGNLRLADWGRRKQ